MEGAIRTRLTLIQNSVELQISSAKGALLKLTENQIPIEEAQIIKTKLISFNKTFEQEMFRYFELLENPPEDEVSKYTLLQLEASDLIAELEVKIQQNDPHNVPERPVREHINVTSQLPRMELAKFDGDILKWYEFWDQFSSNVDNRNISDVDKLLYLRSVLEGEAKQTVEGLNTTNKNYQIAVDTLKERYGKPSAIIDAHYVALYRIKTAGKSVQHCRRVLNDVERHLRVLKSLGENVNHNHLRVMIMEKFPEDLIYELRMKMKSEEESIEEIRKHLEHIVSARESSNRIKRDLQELQGSSAKPENDHFTLEAFHVKSERKKDNRASSSKRTFLPNNKNFQYDKSKKPNFYNQRKRHFNHENPINHHERKKQRVSCIFCDKDHFNDECLSVKTVQDRKLALRNRCFICLSEGHKATDCKFKRKCYHCGKFGNHNRALCPKVETINSTKTKTFCTSISKEDILLQTAVVKIQQVRHNPKELNGRVLLDCGSQRSYITKRVAKELDLPIIEETCLSIYTFGADSPQEVDSPVVHFQIVTRTEKCATIYANVVSHITNSIRCPCNIINDLKQKTDINFTKMIMADDGSRSNQVDFLLGNDYYHSFMSNEKIEIQRGLFLINSDFGWVWSGKCNFSHETKEQLSALTYHQVVTESNNNFNEPDLPLRNDYLKKLWNLESIGITDSPKTTRDDEAIKQFNETTKYLNNRYYVTWPWIEYPPTLPINLGLAYGRLTNLIKRLDLETLTEYDRIIKEQLDQGIIELVPNTPITSEHPVHYLPHHCILRENKSTKLRIVYDASAKLKNHSSLNECLYRGPLMLEDLTGILIKFREHRFGLTADVEKAFLQIGLQEKDRDVTRFLWIKDTQKGTDSENLIHLRFCRVLFGVISSPFLLNATIKYHLENSKHPMSTQIAEDIYVDNLVTGTNTISETIEMHRSSKDSFNELTMNLREWYSNSLEFMNSIPKEDRGQDTDFVNILGIAWNIKNDQLHLKANLDKKIYLNIHSKRDVLKIIASIYDPCGFVAPLILPAKVFLQDLWKQKVKWDTPLSTEALEKWQRIAKQLKNINQYHIPRFYAAELSNQLNDNNINDMTFELHCFTDASKQAYAAVIYLRSTLNKKSVVNFIIGKSRLVPIKDQDDLHIPRLELLGALIGSRLIRYVKKYLRLQIQKQYLWTDSQVVRNWCSSHKLLPPFVAKRVNEIKQNQSLNIRYVPTNLNPADTATRPSVEINNAFWLTGPNFLTQNSSKWPTEVNTREIKNQPTNSQTFLVREGSSNLHITDEENQTPQTIPEANDSRCSEELGKLETIKKLQKEHFPREINGTETDLTKTLGLYKDEMGILKCAGRFKHASWPETQKYPILLPKKTEFTYKIIETTHVKNYHVGVSQTLALVRMKYWIPQGRAQVKRVLKKCQQCRKYGGGPYKLPPMAPLPAERINYYMPFTYTGLDYFGPLTTKNGTTEKHWVCLFTCLAVRAIHMEVVKDLTAEECLLALRRFISIRGLPKCIISDNALQFKLTSEVLTNKYCIQNDIKWKFIPELAPWFGGFYERLVGLVKHCLKRTIDKHLVNNNQLSTIIAEISSVVNTRPLTTVGEELEHVLKPSDFIHVGGPLVTEGTETEFLDPATVTKTNLIEGWKRGQIILGEFSKMFINQYLTSLRNRKDLHKQARITVDVTPKIGDIVQIKDGNNRSHWKVGKITSVIKGSDGHIRVAKVSTSKNETLTRSIAHLYPLELEDHQTSSMEETQSDKPTRESAQKAKQKLKEWTAQLFSN